MFNKIRFVKAAGARCGAEVSIRNARGMAWWVGLAALTGCVSPNIHVDRAISSLRSANDPPALVWSEGLKGSFYSEQLGYIETGRIRMLSGDFHGSSQQFSTIIDQVIQEQEGAPVVRLGDAGATVLAGTITDDRARAYDLPAYEFILTLQYQMLNHLFLGRPDAAIVEARRAVFAQDQIAETYGAEVERARQEAELSHADTFSKVGAQMQAMEPVVEKTRSSFENGVTWYLCGVLFEQEGDQANAAVALRKAWELMPGNPYVLRDFLRLLRTQDPEGFRNLLAQTGVDPSTLERPATEILLIMEEGFVSQRHSVKIPLPVGGTLTSIDFPIYQDPPHQPMAVEVRIADQSRGLSALGLSVQALAYRDLKERMPGIAVRNVTRVATRIAAQQVANQIGGDAAQLGVLAFNLVSTIINRADTRAWYTLPMVAHLFRGGIEPGAHSLELRNQGTGYVTRIPVSVAEGETRIVWIADLGGNARVVTASLNGKGAPTSFQVTGSLLHGFPAMALPGSAMTLHGAGVISTPGTDL